MSGTVSKQWRCSVWGYVHEGPEPPEAFPICGAPASEFAAVEPSVAAPAKEATDTERSWVRVAGLDEVPEGSAKAVAVDMGNNTYSFGRSFERQRQSVLMSGYLGSIGFGYPAAMGAALPTDRAAIGYRSRAAR